jgi:thioredoxin-like negative regulator of GroEL
MEDIILTNFDIKKGTYEFVLSSDPDGNVYGVQFNSSLVVFELWNEQCTMCPNQEKVLNEFKEKYGEKINVFKLNIGYQGNFSFAQNFPLRQLPSLVFFTSHKKPYFFNGLTHPPIIDFFLDHFEDEGYCINCEKAEPLRQKKDNYYFCRELEDFRHFKDICGVEEKKIEAEPSEEELMEEIEKVAREEAKEKKGFFSRLFDRIKRFFRRLFKRSS